MISRLLDEDHPAEVRRLVPLLTLARLVGNSTFRFATPFLAVIGRGFGVSLPTMGEALSAGEFTGLVAPFIGRRVDRHGRRQAMSIGAVVVGLGALIAAISPTAAVFALAIVTISFGKLLFDPAMGAWIGDRVDYANRARVIGVTELSWAGSMLLTIPVLGLVVATAGWRWAYAVLAVAGAAIAWAVRRALPEDRIAPAERTSARRFTFTRATTCGVAGFALLMMAANCLFVVFGAWLEDAFGFSPAAIGATAIVLGVAEVTATSSTIRFTDRIGKRRAVIVGAALRVPLGLALSIVGHHVVLGLAIVGVYVAGFEFAIVSGLPLLTELQPHARAASLGIAVGLGTVGRGIVSIVATRLYAAHGVGAAGALGSLFAAGVVVTYAIGLRAMR